MKMDHSSNQVKWGVNCTHYKIRRASNLNRCSLNQLTNSQDLTPWIATSTRFQLISTVTQKPLVTSKTKETSTSMLQALVKVRRVYLPKILLVKITHLPILNTSMDQLHCQNIKAISLKIKVTTTKIASQTISQLNRNLAQRETMVVYFSRMWLEAQASYQTLQQLVTIGLSTKTK